MKINELIVDYLIALGYNMVNTEDLSGEMTREFAMNAVVDLTYTVFGEYNDTIHLCADIVRELDRSNQIDWLQIAADWNDATSGPSGEREA